MEFHPAAVLVPVYKDEEGYLKVVLIRRSRDGVHGGEIALPGGKRNSQDHSLTATALREAKEEIGIDPNSVDILEQLPVVDTVVTGYRIHPFLGRIVPPPVWRLDAREVAEIIEVRLEEFTKPGIHGEETRRFPFKPAALNIRYYRIGSHQLWGATYRILHPLIPRLLSGEWLV
jgi:8-oxo-dGTP pyrophosphatase MutT (NUDIX family)